VGYWGTGMRDSDIALDAIAKFEEEVRTYETRFNVEVADDYFNNLFYSATDVTWSIEILALAEYLRLEGWQAFSFTKNMDMVVMAALINEAARVNDWAQPELRLVALFDFCAFYKGVRSNVLQ
jgi:hypothetical protein